MSNIRHTVVVRRDLQLSPGLLAAQVAHISDQFMRNKICSAHADLSFTTIEEEWTLNPYLSVLAVNTSEELDAIYREAKAANLDVRMWEDVIPSEILQKPIRVRVGLSIGPDDFDKIKLITGTLPLY